MGLVSDLFRSATLLHFAVLVVSGVGAFGTPGYATLDDEPLAFSGWFWAVWVIAHVVLLVFTLDFFKKHRQGGNVGIALIVMYISLTAAVSAVSFERTPYATWALATVASWSAIVGDWLYRSYDLSVHSATPWFGAALGGINAFLFVVSTAFSAAAFGRASVQVWVWLVGLPAAFSFGHGSSFFSAAFALALIALLGGSTVSSSTRIGIQVGTVLQLALTVINSRSLWFTKHLVQ